MAKHRIQTPSRSAKVARNAVITGSLVLSAGAISAAPALADEVNIPGIGTFDIPGLKQNQIPKQFQGAADKAGKAPKISAPTLKPKKQASANARAAAAAKSKIGSPYQWGAAGPNAFDCSGLIYWSYQQVGKTLPRDSYGLLGGGTAVSRDDLQPGDVIIYNGGSHAGIYIGNGQIVHSSTEGVPVQTMPVFSWDYTAARRY